MQDVPDIGARPIVLRDDLDSGSEHNVVLGACPGAKLEHTYDPKDADLLDDVSPVWGPVKGLWEGFAADSEIRFSGSSGGAASALALYALEAGDFHSVLHTAARADTPYLNEPVVSTTREELLARTGSRYAPASPCERLDAIENADGPCVFIGKPCDVAAANMARALRPMLDKNLEITIAFFCAGTPSTQGTLEMLRAMGISDPSVLTELRYRGNGWPGFATALAKDHSGKESSHQLTYEQSWGDILSKHVQWRCRLCLDHTGEFADIAVGDPWYRDISPGEPGSSLILARTAKGLRFVEAALNSGYLIAESVPGRLLPASQPNLLKTRGAVWGRLRALQLIGAVAPTFIRMPAFRLWVALSVAEKLRSVFGTLRRCLQRGLHPLQRSGPKAATELAGSPNEHAAAKLPIKRDV